MKVKHLKNKIIIESNKEDFNDLVTRINELSNLLNTIHEINDLYLSDITTLEKLKYQVVNLLDLNWNSDNYKYVIEENKHE